MAGLLILLLASCQPTSVISMKIKPEGKPARYGWLNLNCPENVWAKRISQDLGSSDLQKTPWVQSALSLKAEDFWLIQPAKTGSGYNFFRPSSKFEALKSQIQSAKLEVQAGHLAVPDLEPRLPRPFTTTLVFVVKATDQNIYIFKLTDLDFKSARAQRYLENTRNIVSTTTYQKYIESKP